MKERWLLLRTTVLSSLFTSHDNFCSFLLLMGRRMNGWLFSLCIHSIQVHRAEAAFRYALVYDVMGRRTVRLAPLPEHLSCLSDSERWYLGVDFDDNIVAHRFAHGHLNPLTMEAFDHRQSPPEPQYVWQIRLPALNSGRHHRESSTVENNAGAQQGSQTWWEANMMTRPQHHGQGHPKTTPSDSLRHRQNHVCTRGERQTSSDHKEGTRSLLSNHARHEESVQAMIKPGAPSCIIIDLPSYASHGMPKPAHGNDPSSRSEWRVASLRSQEPQLSLQTTRTVRGDSFSHGQPVMRQNNRRQNPFILTSKSDIRNLQSKSTNKVDDTGKYTKESANDDPACNSRQTSAEDGASKRMKFSRDDSVSGVVLRKDAENEMIWRSGGKAGGKQLSKKRETLQRTMRSSFAAAARNCEKIIHYFMPTSNDIAP